jgi:hypothetical protein
MSKRIIIDPVTRIEGHAKISIFMDEAGHVSDAEFHVAALKNSAKAGPTRKCPASRSASAAFVR